MSPLASWAGHGPLAPRPLNPPVGRWLRCWFSGIAGVPGADVQGVMSYSHASHGGGQCRDCITGGRLCDVVRPGPDRNAGQLHQTLMQLHHMYSYDTSDVAETMFVMPTFTKTKN